jgi:hypothetical protein
MLIKTFLGTHLQKTKKYHAVAAAINIKSVYAAPINAARGEREDAFSAIRYKSKTMTRSTDLMGSKVADGGSH